MKKAIIAAVNAYPDPHKLQGSLNDMADLKATLEAKGFSVSTLADSGAIKANIILQLTDLVAQAQPGDHIIFAFFGHGSYISGAEPDGRTECICPYDVFQGGLITDDELAARLAPLRAGVICDVILGCCYAGTGTRLAEVNEKGKKKKLRCLCIPGPLPAPALDATKGVKTAVPVHGMNHVLWAACKDSQLSYEGTVSGKKRGIFPTYLCYAFRSMAGSTRSQIDAYVTRKVMALVPAQEPQTEGPSEMLVIQPFG